MLNALTKGLIDFGLTYHDANKRLAIMDDYDAGVRYGREMMLDAIMGKLVSRDKWMQAKAQHDTHLQIINDATANRTGVTLRH